MQALYAVADNGFAFMNGNNIKHQESDEFFLTLDCGVKTSSSTQKKSSFN